MDLADFLRRARGLEAIEFAETMAVIETYYVYQPTAFSNGLAEPVQNAAGQNEGSCKIFAFAKLHALDAPGALNLFGAYYRRDVLLHPEGQDHANIRRFMRDGWAGVKFEGEPLHAKAADAG